MGWVRNICVVIDAANFATKHKHAGRKRLTRTVRGDFIWRCVTHRQIKSRGTLEEIEDCILAYCNWGKISALNSINALVSCQP